jgi:cytochrome P450 PksS
MLAAFLAAFLAAANADPAKFEHPHQFDIAHQSNHTFSFGTGPHFCLGFQLARAETAIAFECILVRFPDIRPAVDEQQMAGASASAYARWCNYL